MTGLPFFDRLDAIDSAWRTLEGAGLVAELAHLVREPASANYVCSLEGDRQRDTALVLLRAAAVMNEQTTSEYSTVVDILESRAMQLWAQDPNRAGVPVPHSPRQLRVLLTTVVDATSVPTWSQITAVDAAFANVDAAAVTPRTVSKFINGALAVGGFNAAASLLTSAGLTRSPVQRGGHESWWRAELLKDVLPQLVEVAPAMTYRFFREAMDRIIGDDPNTDASSGLWRPHMEPGGDRDDWRGQVLDGLLLSAAQLLGDTQYPGETLLEALWATSHEIFKRGSLWLATTTDREMATFVEDRVREVSTDGTSYQWEREFKDLLVAKGHVLGDPARDVLMRWIEGGPDFDDRPELTGEALESAKDLWIRDWLSVVEPLLTSRLRGRLAELQNNLGTEGSRRWERGVRAGFVRQVSPVDVAEMLDWPLEEVDGLLVEASDSSMLGSWLDFEEVSRAGLTDAVAKAIRERPEWLSTGEDGTLKSPISRGIAIEALQKSVSERPDGEVAHDPTHIARFVLWVLEQDELETQQLWSAARVAEWVIGHEDATALPDVVVSLVDLLVRHASTERDNGFEDPSVASLNAPAGIAANLACRTYIMLAQAEGIEDLSVPRQSIEELISRQSAPIHASFGRWIEELNLVDPDLVSAIRPQVFHEFPTLFTAAWGAYVRYARLLRGAGERLRAEYVRVVQDDLDFGTDRIIEQVTKSTTEHLLVLAVWGEMESGPSSLLDTWFGKLSVGQRADAHLFLASEAATGEVPPNLRRRMEKLVEWRLGTSDEPREFEHLGLWVRADVSAAWKLDVLRRAGADHLNPMHGDDVLRFLAGLTPETVEEDLVRIAIAAGLATAGDVWRLDTWKGPLEQLIRSSLELGHSHAQTLELVNYLGHMGVQGLRPLYLVARDR